MAVTVLQAPTTPNVTGTNLVYSLSSSLAGSPQFRYVTDIYEGSDYITTIKTYPNVYGSGIVDVARELDDQLQYDKFWTSIEYDAVETAKIFNLKFGEEYGTSLSSSITTYTGSSDNLLQVFPGHVYKNQGSYNFNTSSVVNRNNILSNAPEALYNPEEEDFMFVNFTDYHTITLLEGKDLLINARIYSGSTILTTIQYFSINNFNTCGIGPQNILDAGGTSVPTMYSATQIEVTNSGNPLYTLTLPNHPAYPCSDEYTRFAFINQYGFWDYYNVYNPLRKNTQVGRSLYDKPFVRYEDSIGSYNISDRGNTQYRTQYNDSYIITTDYITKETSQWLTELFESPEVYIQKNGNFIPVNITNTNVRWNMSTAREKLFQYDIEFKYANNRQSR